MREKEQKTIFVSEKHIKARVILFALAFVIAVGSFTAGIMSLRSKNADTYEEMQAAADNNVPHYGDGIHYYCNFDRVESRLSARELRRQAREYYNEALKHAYQLLDAFHTYPDFVNLATINSCPNEIVTVPEELYKILQDAVGRTSLADNYSVYAGPLFGEWNPILQSENYMDFDPAYNDTQAGRMQSLAEETVMAEMALQRSSLSGAEEPGASGIRLEFLEANRVRLAVPDRAQKLYGALEVTAPLLDLNILHDAYLLELTSALMAKQNITFGYFYADSGILLDLDEKRAYTLFDAGGLEGDGYAYAIEVNGETKLRHQYFCLQTGGFTDLLQTLSIETPAGELIDAAAARACLNGVTDPLQIVSFEGRHPAWKLQYTYQ